VLLAAFQTLRPKQWTKNLILFAPLIFAKEAFVSETLVRATVAFAAFCALSGAIYAFNDLHDLAQDRLHPIKRLRPLASARLTPAAGWAVVILALAAALAGALWLTPGFTTTVHPIGAGAVELISARGYGPSFLTMGLAYAVMNMAYALSLKHIVILDVMIVALGFVLRAVAGAVAIGVDISTWLLVCTVFLALFLSLAKRRHEVVLLEGEASSHRRSLGEYDVAGLDQMIAIVAAVTLMAYALYTTSKDTVDKFGTARLSLTIPFVIYGLFRYIYIVRRKEEGGDPSRSLLNDKPLLLAVALWAFAVIVIIYK